MTTTESHPIFADCVASANHLNRYSLQTAFVADGCVCATDGTIIVRTPLLGEAWETPGAPKTIADLGWERTRYVDAPVSFAPLPPEESIECPECDGTGNGKKDCDECGGVGTRECDMGHDHDCDDCDGDGKVEDPDSPCAECDGTKRIPVPATTMVPDAPVGGIGWLTRPQQTPPGRTTRGRTASDTDH